MKVKAKCEVDCAACAAKLEDAIGKLDGVNSVSVNFLTQKMSLDVDEENSAEVIEKVKKTTRHIEPDTVLKF
ncbi:MAG: cation transporter [Oscillospiraceae bacterium]|jgi:copper chaperone CopZ